MQYVVVLSAWAPAQAADGNDRAMTIGFMTEMAMYAHVCSDGWIV